MKRTSCSVLETRVKDRNSGKPFVCRLRRFSGQNQSPHIAPSDDHQRAVLFELLDEMSEHPNNYRQFQKVANPHTVAFRDKLGVGYRIDSVAEVNVAESTPKVELHYNIGDECHGIVILYLKPRRCPPPSPAYKDRGPAEDKGQQRHHMPRDWSDTLVDDEEETNFTHSLIMSYISDGMQDSAAHRQVNEIEWEVEEAGNDVNPLAGGLVGAGGEDVSQAVKAAMSGRSLHSEREAEEEGRVKSGTVEPGTAGGPAEMEAPGGGPTESNWEKLAQAFTMAAGTGGGEPSPSIPQEDVIKTGPAGGGFEEVKKQEEKKEEQRAI